MWCTKCGPIGNHSVLPDRHLSHQSEKLNIMCIPKKGNGEEEKKFLIVVDFRALNEITKPFIYPILRIDDIMDSIGHVCQTGRF